MEGQEGSFYCDCDTAPNGNFAGLSCEFEAETYCRLPQETTSSWFCTNQGTCVFGSGKSGQSNWKCDCPSEYDGPVSYDCCSLSLLRAEPGYLLILST